MQMERGIDLEKAINTARQSEEIKMQQNTLRSDATGVTQMVGGSVDRLFKGCQQKEQPRHSKFKSKGVKEPWAQSQNARNSQCYRCGEMLHPKAECHARSALLWKERSFPACMPYWQSGARYRGRGGKILSWLSDI